MTVHSNTSFAVLLGALGATWATGCGGRSSLEVLDGTGSPTDSRAGLADSGAEGGERVGCDAPSCVPGGPGMTDCGASAECCCTSLEVTGGTYDRTYTNAGSGPTGEADPATVSGFRLDKYLVTVGRFRQFVAAWNGGNGYFAPAGSGKHTHVNGGQGLANSGVAGGYEQGWDATDWNNTPNIDPTTEALTTACNSPTYGTWTSAAGTQENLPINCVNWWEAEAFCIWDGGFLPSEAELEYAAAGGSQQREYPWGSTAPGAENQYANPLSTA
jgi:formylglycine-generating enzyme